MPTRFLLTCAALLCFILYPSSLILSQTPVLRLETGMHTATINRIATDAQGRWLVTASDDKTARVWELPSGRLLRVLRPPLGEGNEGKLFAVALSPDGNTVAAGGWTKAATGSHSIYLFDRASGRLRQRLTDLPNVVLHLVYSRDGRWLAATLGGANGVRVYAAADGFALAHSDTEYSNDSYGADFDAAGRLATSCYDGKLRLYERDAAGKWRRSAQPAAPHGKKPFAVSFTADGERLAVGYSDTTQVSVVSGRDLTPLFAPDTRGVDNGNLSKVAWSADGQTLYAGGQWDKGGAYPIRRWDNGGQGAARDIVTAAHSTIFHLAALPMGGGELYGAAEPSFGLIDGSGAQRLAVTAAVADYRAGRDGFRVAGDGSAVAFGYEYGGKTPARFNVAWRALTLGAGSDGLAAPLTQRDGLAVTDWKNTTEPKLNGQALKLEQYEISRSLALAADGSAFLLGTAYRLRLYERDGRERWQKAIPGEAWSVNLSGDGRLAAAAFADGTIRWYRVTDGAELLAFFPHGDKQRWVLWTPSGYYDASAGAEDFIGWQVNNGPDAAADFYPVGLFRERFYRPDIVAKALYTLDEAKAVAFANEAAGRRQTTETVARKLPPVVEIVTPPDNGEVSANTITVRYNARSEAALTSVKALINGRPAEIVKGGGTRLTANGELTVTVPAQDCVLSLIAENENGPGAAASVRLRWRGRVEAELKAKLYVLAVGVSQYQNASQNLNFAAKDAQDLVNLLRGQEGKLYAKVEAKLLTDAEATRENILDGLDWITRQTTSKDVAVVFLSGHGDNDQFGQYYFLPYGGNFDRLKSTGLVFLEIKNTVKLLAGKVLFFVDSCHSGNTLGGKPKGNPDMNRIINELSDADNGAVVFAASTNRQFSLEDARWGNGAFTKAVLEGLSGCADNKGSGRVTVTALDYYIAERVKELTGGRQTPTTAKPNTVQDFPISVAGTCRK